MKSKDLFGKFSKIVFSEKFCPLHFYSIITKSELSNKRENKRQVKFFKNYQTRFLQRHSLVNFFLQTKTEPQQSKTKIKIDLVILLYDTFRK